MANTTPTDRPTQQQLAAFIVTYQKKEQPNYEVYQAALKRVLERACALSVPEAVVQARAKSRASFAEKCVRKFAKYGGDPVSHMTDLCGGRVIVQTLQQVRAVRLFIEQNFTIVEFDDKGLLLGEQMFGSRDMHFLVQLRPDRAAAIGFSAADIKTIGRRIAEVQVRTWVQHAWADTLHDRMYKAPLKLSSETKRTGALLAAVMEEGDRAFDRLATEIDGMVANYAAYHGKAQVQEEISTQELLLATEDDPAKKSRTALQLARLLGPNGEYEKAVRVLEPFADIDGAIRYDILLELGYALCRSNRQRSATKEYQRGKQFLTDVVAHCRSGSFQTVPHLRKQNSTHSRALSRLAWSWEAVPDGEGHARELYGLALEMEPFNPYLLASQLGFEIFCLHSHSMVESMRSTIKQAIETCREHAAAGIELPFAWFTGGRLSLLLGDADDAIGWYARGLRYMFDPDACFSTQVLDDEVQWIRRIHHGQKTLPREHGWIERLIGVIQRAHRTMNGADGARPGPSSSKRVLIIAGGAAAMSDEAVKSARPMVEAALEAFHGVVISGGTAVGVPGLVGEFSARLKKQRRKGYELLGYRPKSPPKTGPIDDRYDRAVESDESAFSTEQIVKIWEDLIDGGTLPGGVSLLGLGGGPLTAVEYYVALAMGATVGVVQLPKTAATSTNPVPAVEAESILTNPLWQGASLLLPLPYDVSSVRAFANAATQPFEQAKLDEMAEAIHAQYVAQSSGKLPANMKPWPKLDRTYQIANQEQARYAVEIVRAAGFEIRKASTNGKPIMFTPKQVEMMAELEHGRWNIERLRNGWRFGKTRSDDKKIHDCLVTWEQLPEPIRDYDRAAVRAFPDILGKAGLEIYRP